jgi:hypothetical protein
MSLQRTAINHVACIFLLVSKVTDLPYSIQWTNKLIKPAIQSDNSVMAQRTFKFLQTVIFASVDVPLPGIATSFYPLKNREI